MEGSIVIKFCIPIEDLTLPVLIQCRENENFEHDKTVTDKLCAISTSL